MAGFQVQRSNIPAKALEIKQKMQQRNAGIATEAIAAIPSVPEITSFTLNTANAAAGAEQNAVYFNTNSQVTILPAQGADITTTSVNGATYANLVAGFGYKPFASAGFEYQVEDISQFSRSFQKYYSNGVGNEGSLPINPQIAFALRQIPSNPNVLTLWINYPDKIQAGMAYVVNVNRASELNLTFSVIPMTQPNL